MIGQNYAEVYKDLEEQENSYNSTKSSNKSNLSSQIEEAYSKDLSNNGFKDTDDDQTDEISNDEGNFTEKPTDAIENSQIERLMKDE